MFYNIYYYYAFSSPPPAGFAWSDVRWACQSGLPVEKIEDHYGYSFYQLSSWCCVEQTLRSVQDSISFYYEHYSFSFALLLLHFAVVEKVRGLYSVNFTMGSREQ